VLAIKPGTFYHRCAKLRNPRKTQLGTASYVHEAFHTTLFRFRLNSDT